MRLSAGAAYAAAIALSACALLLSAGSDDGARIAKFSQAGANAALPAGWKPLVVRGIAPSRYAIVRDDEQVVLRAEALASASGLAFSLSPRPMRGRCAGDGRASACPPRQTRRSARPTTRSPGSTSRSGSLQSA